MDMNKSFCLRKEDRAPQWRVIDAQGKVLGRLATQIALALRGKDRPFFTAHTDSGDYIVVTNVEKVVLTGDKWDKKEYARYTGWMGGYKVRTARELLAKHPGDLLYLAVKRMLPANRLSRALLRKLKLYVGAAHPHQAQISTSSKTTSSF